MTVRATRRSSRKGCRDLHGRPLCSPFTPSVPHYMSGPGRTRGYPEETQPLSLLPSFSFRSRSYVLYALPNAKLRRLASGPRSPFPSRRLTGPGNLPLLPPRRFPSFHVLCVLLSVGKASRGKASSFLSPQCPPSPRIWGHSGDGTVRDKLHPKSSPPFRGFAEWLGLAALFGSRRRAFSSARGETCCALSSFLPTFPRKLGRVFQKQALYERVATFAETPFGGRSIGLSKLSLGSFPVLFFLLPQLVRLRTGEFSTSRSACTRKARE